MNEVRESMQQMQKFVAENLADCCQEILEWHNTSVLPKGKVREAAKCIRDFMPINHLNIVENEIKSQALKKVANES